MGYVAVPETDLRFGDVLQGLPAILGSLDDPNKGHEYSIQIQASLYNVILTPCCNLNEGIITLTPLKKVEPNYFSNPYLEQDLTNINRKMLPENMLPPLAWTSMSPEDKAEKMAVGFAFGFLNKFIYGPHDLLESYRLDTRGVQRTLSHYQLDFKNAFSIVCNKMKNPNETPLAMKILQLDVSTRAELREKYSWFVGRVPEEDMAAAD